MLTAPTTASRFSSCCRLDIACWFPFFSHYSLSAFLFYQAVSNGGKDTGHVPYFHPRPTLYEHSSTSPQSLPFPCICLVPSSSDENFRSLNSHQESWSWWSYEGTTMRKVMSSSLTANGSMFRFHGRSHARYKCNR